MFRGGLRSIKRPVITALIFFLLSISYYTAIIAEPGGSSNGYFDFEYRESSTQSSRNGNVDDWYMFRHDPERSGNTTSKAPNKNSILWKNQMQVNDYTWGYCGSPAVAGGVVYQGGQRPDIMLALDAVTKEEKWQTPVGGRITSSPTISNNRVLFTAYDRRVYSLRTDNGILDWSVPLIHYADSSPTVANGRVFVGEGQGDYVGIMPASVYCLDESTGFERWRFQAGGQVISSPTVVNNAVIFGSYDGHVYSLPTIDPSGDGWMDLNECNWQFFSNTRFVASAAVYNDMVFIGDIDGYLYALPFTDKNMDKIITIDEVLWKFKTGNEIWSSVAVSNGRIFVGSHDHTIYALPLRDPNRDGVISNDEVLWKYRVTDKIWSSPAVAGGKIFFTSQDYKLWALSEETGKFIWNYTMPIQTTPYGSEYLYSSPAIVDGRIYVGNYDLTLYCFGSVDATPVNISAVSPANNSINVPLNTDIEINFDDDLCEGLITENSVIIESLDGQRIKAKITYDSENRKLKINPDIDLAENERYTVRLRSNYFQDDAGNSLDGNGNGVLENSPEDDYIWHFNTSLKVGEKPRLKNTQISPGEGYITTYFEFITTYFDADNDPPVITRGGYIRLFIDDAEDGIELHWANDSNNPDSRLLDRDFTNGELYRLRMPISGIGDHTFFIECSDGNNTNRSNVIAMPRILNSPPELEIPVQYVTEDIEYQLNLTDYVSDIDNTSDQMTFTEDSEYCSIKDRIYLPCKFPESGNGSVTVNISVTDGVNLVWQKVLFVIEPNNDPPFLKPPLSALPPQTVFEDEQSVYELGDYIMDPDTPEELLTVETDSQYITTSGLRLFMRYPYTVTSEKVTVSVSDGFGMLVTGLNITVIPVNDAPILSVPQLQLTEDEETKINLGLFISDEESVPGELEINVSSQKLGSLELVGGLWIIVSYPEGILEDYLNITVVDGNITVFQTVRVNIKPVNDSPTLISPSANQVQGRDKNMYNFSVWFADEDLLSGNTVEPKVELVLDGELYSLDYIKESENTKTNRLYAITLSLSKGRHQYLIRCDDGSGESNSKNTTAVLTLEVLIEEKPKDDKNTGPIILDVTRTGGLRELLYLFVIIIIIIALVFVNLWLVLKRKKSRKPASEKPVIATAPILEQLPPKKSELVDRTIIEPKPVEASKESEVIREDETVEPVIIYTKPVTSPPETDTPVQDSIPPDGDSISRNDGASDDIQSSTRGDGT